MDLIAIARVCHETNRAYCQTISDMSQVPWSEAPEWQMESAVNGVKFIIGAPDSTPKDSHVSWFNEKLEQGWTYGPVKDVEKKEHPCMVPYEELPAAQRMKDHLFRAIVLTMTQEV